LRYTELVVDGMDLTLEKFAFETMQMRKYKEKWMLK
jgi:hypothetical protein